jgi:uncharacterized membrane protein (GlpM family)
MLQLVIKTALIVIIILAVTALGKKLPVTAGLITVMPLTGALALVWLYLENRGDSVLMQNFTRGALWGMLPSTLFFLTAFICFKKQFALPGVLCVSFGVWLVAALVHQWLLK